MKEKTNRLQQGSVSSKSVIPVGVLAKLKVPRKFEIFIEEYDEEGGPGHTPAWRAVKSDPALGGNGSNPIITISSKAEFVELQQTYHDVGQRFKILREIDPPNEETLRRLAIEQGLMTEDTNDQDQTEQASAAKQDSQSDESDESDESNITPDMAPEVDNEINEVHETCVNPDVKQPRRPVRYYKIGGIDIKDDNGVLFQRQWMKVSPNEASEIRLINDKNNSIVSTVGKHFEMLKWVMIENSDGESEQ